MFFCLKYYMTANAAERKGKYYGWIYYFYYLVLLTFLL